MKHEDGFCDECGCELVAEVYLTFDGQERCALCAANWFHQPRRLARNPEARDDGR